MYTILIVDDHAIVFSGLQMLLKNTEVNCTLEKASDGEEALELIRKDNYDLVIMDINMPNTESLNLLLRMISIRPELRVLVFSMNPEEIFAQHYFKFGAFGYLSKGSANEEVVNAIVRILVHRKNYFSNDVMEILYNDFRQNKKEFSYSSLSEREFAATIHQLNN